MAVCFAGIEDDGLHGGEAGSGAIVEFVLGEGVSIDG